MSRGWKDSSGWWAWARCVEVDPELWFGDYTDTSEPARAICATCPVQPDCLQAALDREHGLGRTFRYGIFGGLDPLDRLDIEQRGEQHGSRSGYHLHQARGEDPCLACRKGRRKRIADDEQRSA